MGTSANTVTSTLTKYINLLQFNTSNSANGGIRISTDPSTYISSTAYYMVEPYFASFAVYFLLETDPIAYKDIAQRWINWWVTHRNATTKTALIHYYRIDGTGEATALTGESPTVQDNFEDATDSNAALFFCLVGRYMAAHGTDGLNSGLLTALQESYDYLASPSLKQADNLTYAKSTYPIKFLMDNIEVHRGLLAVSGAFRVLGDTTRSSTSDSWATLMRAQINVDFKNTTTGLWRIAKDGLGIFTEANLATVYPDCIAQVLPTLFGFEPAFSGYKRVDLVHPGWADAELGGPGQSVESFFAYAALYNGDGVKARKWLTKVVAAKWTGTTYNPIFTPADAAVAQLILSSDYTNSNMSFDRTVNLNYITRETPSGLVNGVNTVFTLKYLPLVGTEMVFLNGALQEVGAGNNYTITNATITFVVAPLSGSRIHVTYWK